jgi:hypothetical protein
VAAPTLIATIQISSPWATTDNIANGVATKAYTGTLSTQAGDLIVVLQGSENAQNTAELTVSDGANSYTQEFNIETDNYCSLNIATAEDSSGGTRSLTLARASTSGAICLGGIAFQFRDHGGVGNSSGGDTNQTVGLECSPNSALIALCLDFGATTGTRAWDTINGNAPTSTFGCDGDSTNWAAAGAYWADVGGTGTKDAILNSPTFSVPTIAVIEILGSGGGPNYPRMSLLGVG